MPPTNSTVTSLLRVGIPYELLQKYCNYTLLLAVAAPRPKGQERIRVSQR